MERYKGLDIKAVKFGEKWGVLILQPGGGTDWQNTLEADSVEEVVAKAKALIDSTTKPTH